MAVIICTSYRLFNWPGNTGPGNKYTFRISWLTNGPSKSNLLFMDLVEGPVNCPPPLDTWHPCELFIYLFICTLRANKKLKSGLIFHLPASWITPIIISWQPQVCPLNAGRVFVWVREAVCQKGAKGKTSTQVLLPRSRSNLWGPWNRNALWQRNALSSRVFYYIIIAWHHR